jgi:hypothetical protein
VLSTIKEVVHLGIRDPIFFELIGVFEDGIGPDLISDMIGTILRSRLCTYTARVCRELSISTREFKIGSDVYSLPAYLTEQGEERYIILVPEDVLSEMPIALDRSDVPVVAEHNAAARRYLNEKFGKDWQQFVRDHKRGARAALFSERDVFSEFIDSYKARKADPYDFDKDPLNQRLWYDLARAFLKRAASPALSLVKSPTAEQVLAVVMMIVLAFKRNVEHNGLYVVFYDDAGEPRHEHVMQRTFQAIALAYCEGNDLDLAPETNPGRGPVDFKFSRGARARVLVELKRSKNRHLLHGFRIQLPIYQAADNTNLSIYLVIDCADNDTGIEKLSDLYTDEKHNKRN